MHEMMGIPPELDRTLALAILADLRAWPSDRDARAAEAEGPSEEVASAVQRVADALSAQGARPSEIVLALDDAFAALLAGRETPVHRARVQALGSWAQRAVVSRLGYTDPRSKTPISSVRIS
jgi:hypothetical protein